MPLAVGQIDRVVKDELQRSYPDTAIVVSKEAKVALHKATNITLLMLATLADEERKGTQEGPAKKKAPRSTLTVDDVDAALEAAGFGDLLVRLKHSGRSNKKARVE